MFSKLFWLTVITLATVSASNAEDKKETYSSLSSSVETGFDGCIEAYLTSNRGPIDFKVIKFCKVMNRGAK